MQVLYDTEWEADCVKGKERNDNAENSGCMLRKSYVLV